MSERDGLVHWRDFRTLTGVYHRALPPDEWAPDPAMCPDVDPHLVATPLPLPDLAFDADALAEAPADLLEHHDPRKTAARSLWR